MRVIFIMIKYVITQPAACLPYFNSLSVYIFVCKITITDSDNGLSPGRCQVIISTNAGILLIQTSGTNFRKILSGIHIFSFQKMHLKMSSAKWWQFCLSLNVLKNIFWSNIQVIIFLALWSFLMFTRPLFQIKLHLLSTALLNGYPSSPRASKSIE